MMTIAILVAKIFCGLGAVAFGMIFLFGVVLKPVDEDDWKTIIWSFVLAGALGYLALR